MKTLIMLLLITTYSSQSLALNLRACPGRVSGEWNYGRTPDACNASQFGDDKTVYATYPEIIFEDNKNRAQERPRYVEEAYATIQAAARYYIQKRNPKVSDEELRNWVLAVTLVTAQESRMSQYRVASDKHLKLLRGDSLHGNGMMQLDDRSHTDIIKKGLAWNLITNLTYGMDILYTEWLRAPKQRCVGSATNWKARIRSAWAAYNGGSGSICRWTNAGSVWARNDRGFISLYTNPTYKQYLSNATKASSVNVSCLIEKKENCPAKELLTSAVNIRAPSSHQLIKTDANQFCVATNGQLHCVDEFRDAVCLKSLDSALDVNAAPLAPAQSFGASVIVEDRHLLCGHYDATVFPVGASLTTGQTLALRSTPGAGVLRKVPSGTLLTVLDFEVRQAPANDRYYKVRYSGVNGWIYGGNLSDAQTFATATTLQPTPNTNLASRGEQIHIRNQAGINLRDGNTNELLAKVPQNTAVTVEDVKVSGNLNQVYYVVNYAGHTGLVYSGELLPRDTTALWTTRVHP